MSLLLLFSISTCKGTNKRKNSKRKNVFFGSVRKITYFALLIVEHYGKM